MLFITKVSTMFFLTANANQAMGVLNFVPLILLSVLMYFLILRPQKKRQKEVETLRASLKAGNRVVTIGGFVGKIKKVTEDEVFLVLNDELKHVVIKKWAVQSIIDPKAAKDIEKTSKEVEDIVDDINDEIVN